MLSSRSKQARSTLSNTTSTMSTVIESEEQHLTSAEDHGDSLTNTLFLPEEEQDNDDMSVLPEVFQYSNYYTKLTNGNWLVHYRTSDKRIIGSCEVRGCLI